MVTAKKAAAKKAPAKKMAAKKAAPAKKAPAKAPVAKKAPAKKAAAKKAAPRKPNAAFMKAMTPSPALAAVIGAMAVPRTEVTSKLWARKYSWGWPSLPISPSRALPRRRPSGSRRESP